MKYIYGGTDGQARDFIRRNRDKLVPLGYEQYECYRTLHEPEQLQGLPRDGSVEILAVGDWKHRDGSGSLVSEAERRGIKILTKDGYYERT